MAPEMALPEEETLEAEDVGPPWVALLQWAEVPHMAPHPFLEPLSTGPLLQAHHHTSGDHLWDSHPPSEVPRHQCTEALPWVCLLRGLHQWCMDHQSSAPLLASLQQDHHLSLGLTSTQPFSPLGPLWLCPSMRCPMACLSLSLRRL
jgi:hypothetical protein